MYCVYCCDGFCRFSLFQLSRNHISFFLHVNVIQLAIFALFYYSIFTPFLSHANTITLNGDLTVVEHSHLIELHFNCSITVDSSFLSNYYKIKDNNNKKHQQLLFVLKVVNFGWYEFYCSKFTCGIFGYILMAHFVSFNKVRKTVPICLIE